MNTHKHARLTYARRLEMVHQMTFEGLSFAKAGVAHGVTPATARKWLGRFLAGGESALMDASSRPARSPRSIDPGKALLIVELRHRHMLQAQIARSVGVSESTVSRVLARAGLSKLSDLRPVELVQRYEHEAPGDLLHIDTKKLGRIVRPSHRVTGNRRDGAQVAGALPDWGRVRFDGCLVSSGALATVDRPWQGAAHRRTASAAHASSPDRAQRGASRSPPSAACWPGRACPS